MKTNIQPRISLQFRENFLIYITQIVQVHIFQINLTNLLLNIYSSAIEIDISTANIIKIVNIVHGVHHLGNRAFHRLDRFLRLHFHGFFRFLCTVSVFCSSFIAVVAFSSTAALAFPFISPVSFDSMLWLAFNSALGSESFSAICGDADADAEDFVRTTSATGMDSCLQMAR